MGPGPAFDSKTSDVLEGNTKCFGLPESRSQKERVALFQVPTVGQHLALCTVSSWRRFREGRLREREVTCARSHSFPESNLRSVSIVTLSGGGSLLLLYPS